jgi:hypothetical protein
MRHNYELLDDQLVYRVEINPKLADQYHEELDLGDGDSVTSVTSSELLPVLPKTLTERLFYNVRTLN